MSDKPYTLRRLNGEDLWPVLAIIGKVIPDDLSSMFMDIVTGNRTMEEVGGVAMLRIVSSVIKDIGKVKEEVYAFLEDVSGMNRDEINALGFMTVPKMIWEIYNTEKDFFGQQA